MSDSEELQPLVKLDPTSPHDLRDLELGRALEHLYPSAPLPGADEAGWSRLAAKAEAIGRRRRAFWSVREWLVSLPGPARAGAGAAIAAVALGVPAFLLWVTLSTRTERLPRFEVAASEHSPVELELVSGAKLQLDRGAAKIDQVDAAQTRVTLLAGGLTTQVPPMGQGGAFIVTTSDCDVVVHGTRFRVEKGADETRVSVEEGVVEVRPHFGKQPPQLLRTRQAWVVLGRAKYVAGLAERVRVALGAPPCEAPQIELEEFISIVDSPSAASGAQYLLALCAAERGETSRAIALFLQSASAASASDPVRADNALARAAQLSATVGQAEGIEAWKRYRVQFPQGLHQTLADRELKRLGGSR